MLSYIESLTRQFLKIYIKSSCNYNFRPKWLNGLELDIYFPEFKLAIEVNGANHFLSNKQKYNDSIKSRLCSKNNVKLIIITHPVELLNNIVIKRLRDITKFSFEYSLLPEKLFQKIVSYKQEFNEKYYKDKYNTKSQNKKFYIEQKQKKINSRIAIYNIQQAKEKYK